MYFVIYDNPWFKYNMIYSMFDFITPIPWCISMVEELHAWDRPWTTPSRGRDTSTFPMSAM